MTTDIITIGCGLPIGASGRRNRLAECPLGINGNICMKKGAFLSHFFSFLFFLVVVDSFQLILCRWDKLSFYSSGISPKIISVFIVKFLDKIVNIKTLIA